MSLAYLNPPEQYDARFMHEVQRRAEDLAGDSFDSLDRDAQDWLEDQWGTDEVRRCLYALIRGPGAVLAKERLRDKYIQEREESYRDQALHDIEAGYVTEE